jgi:Holliday junction resolvasome RuvABC endonuclease subunit
MAHPKKWVLGIDPGFGNTGAVLRLADSRKVHAARCWLNDEVQDWYVLRAMSIAIPMMEQCLAWITEYDIECLEVCIEEPVFNKNPRNLMVQMALFALIQAYVYDYLVPHVPEVYLTLVNPKTSKRLLAHDGNAKKDAMVKASPWYKHPEANQSQREALADAFAHSLAAETQQFALHNLNQYMVEANYSEGS